MKERDGVSFAHEVKEEIARNERSMEEERAFLSALLRENGRLRIAGEAPLAVELDSELAATAKAAYRAFRRLYGIRARFSYSRSTSLGGRTLFHVIAEEGVEEVLKDLEVDFLAPSFPEKVLRSKGAVAAYLSGAFLAGGSVNDPATPSYHLEIALRSEEFARFLRKLLNRRSGHPFQGKVIKRRGQHVLYLKKADQVSNFLILVGARNCCLRFENFRVDREFANYDNRVVNLDGANLRKSMRSGERQKERILLFEEEHGLSSLHNPKLEALLRLRLLHPEASLQELSELLSEELGSKVSRSNVNHLFRKFEEEWGDGR